MIAHVSPEPLLHSVPLAELRPALQVRYQS